MIREEELENGVLAYLSKYGNSELVEPLNNFMFSSSREFIFLYIKYCIDAKKTFVVEDMKNILIQKKKFIEKEFIDFCEADYIEISENDVNRLREVSKKRHLMFAVDKVIENFNGKKEIDDIIINLNKDLKNLENSIAPTDLVIGEKTKTSFLEQLKERANKKNTITTGFNSIDRYTNGLETKQLYIIGARPKNGKTALALNIFKSVAKQQIKTMFVSLEMPIFELQMRLISHKTQINHSDIKNYNLTDYEKQTVEDATKLCFNNMVFSEAITLRSIVSSITKAVREENVKVVFIDYLQLIEHNTGRSSDNVNNIVSAISRKLKLLSKELDICIVCLSQLNREAEKHNYKSSGGSYSINLKDATKTKLTDNFKPNKPRLSDLRDSGSIEQDADIVILLNQENEDGTIINLGIRANRHGETGDIKMNFKKHTMTFSEFSENQEINYPKM